MDERKTSNNPRRGRRDYHRDYYYGPEGMTEHDDWRTSDFDPRFQRHDDAYVRRADSLYGSNRYDRRFAGPDHGGLADQPQRHPEGMWESMKNFFGKGPKNWRRSDDRIHEDACEALTRDSHVDATEITVEVREGVVRLNGHVESRAMKRRAEEVVEFVLGVKDVSNELSVAPAEPETGAWESGNVTNTTRTSLTGNKKARASGPRREGKVQ